MAAAADDDGVRGGASSSSAAAAVVVVNIRDDDVLPGPVEDRLRLAVALDVRGVFMRAASFVVVVVDLVVVAAAAIVTPVLDRRARFLSGMEPLLPLLSLDV